LPNQAPPTIPRRQFEFHKRGQLFIRLHNEMLFASVMRVCKIVHPLRGTESQSQVPHPFTRCCDPAQVLAELKRRNFKVAIACAVGFGDLVRDSFRQIEK
jgi:hypothetical protein